MILQELVNIVQNSSQGTVPLGCKYVPIAAQLFLDGDGAFIGFQKTAKGYSQWGPFINPSNSGKPGLGIHKLEHLIGYRYPRPTTAEEQQKAKVAESKGLKSKSFLAKCSVAINSSELRSLCRFLDSLETNADLQARVYREIAELNLNSGLNIEVLVNGVAWFQTTEVVDFWLSTGYAMSDQRTKGATAKETQSRSLSSLQAEKSKVKDEPIGQCLVCGETKPIARLMDISLDGFKDKPKLVSFNHREYTSRCLTQTFNSPLCKTCAELAPKGWNSLIAQEDSHTVIGDYRYVFWGELPPLRTWGTKPDPAAWLAFIRSAWKRDRRTTCPGKFNMLGLGSHKTTAFIVSFLSQDVDKVTEAILRWGLWQNLFDQNQTRFFSVSDLVRSLRPRSQSGKRAINDGDFSKMEMSQCRDLFMLSLGQGSCPPVLAQVTHRLAIEPENIFGALDRMVLLNICLHSIYRKDVILVEDLVESNRNAFNTGRIFDLIVRSQQMAIGDTGKTIIGTNARLAATRPASILPILITRFHSIYLPKLRRENMGFAVNRARELRELMQCTVFAVAHSPEEMGWFWKGYYDRTIEQTRKGEVDASKPQGEDNNNDME